MRISAGIRACVNFFIFHVVSNKEITYISGAGCDGLTCVAYFKKGKERKARKQRAGSRLVLRTGGPKG